MTARSDTPDLPPRVFEGRRTRLEPATEAHAAALAEVATPGLFVHHFPPREISPEGFAELIRGLSSQPGWRPYAIVPTDGGTAVGMTCFLDIRPGPRTVEIGFTWIAESHQGGATNPECKRLLMGQAFDEWGAYRVQLKTDVRNLQSQRAIEKLGAVREGTLRKLMLRADGTPRDTVMYSVVDEEWPAVRQRLDERIAAFV